jgi:hypothetical protein
MGPGRIPDPISQPEETETQGNPSGYPWNPPVFARLIMWRHKGKDLPTTCDVYSMFSMTGVA